MGARSVLAATAAQSQRVEQALQTSSTNNAAVALLQSIPGVGLRTAEAMVAFLDDPRRFRNAKQVGAYFGLIPCQDQSAQANRLGHIIRDGSPAVRQFLGEAAWQTKASSWMFSLLAPVHFFFVSW